MCGKRENIRDDSSYNVVSLLSSLLAKQYLSIVVYYTRNFIIFFFFRKKVLCTTRKHHSFNLKISDEILLAEEGKEPWKKGKKIKTLSGSHFSKFVVGNVSLLEFRSLNYSITSRKSFHSFLRVGKEGKKS